MRGVPARLGHTGAVALHLSYGPNVPHDGELRLCGDVSAKRVIELGIAHERLTRICFNDYDREIALVADYKNAKTGRHEILVGRENHDPGFRESNSSWGIAEDSGCFGQHH